MSEVRSERDVDGPQLLAVYLLELFVNTFAEEVLYVTR